MNFRCERPNRQERQGRQGRQGRKRRGWKMEDDEASHFAILDLLSSILVFSSLGVLGVLGGSISSYRTWKCITRSQESACLPIAPQAPNVHPHCGAELSTLLQHRAGVFTPKFKPTRSERPLTYPDRTPNLRGCVDANYGVASNDFRTIFRARSSQGGLTHGTDFDC
jgi:hypothetical protein